MADDIARLGFEIDSTQALSAARNLLKLEQAAGKAATGSAKLTTRFRDANGRFISAARAVAENSREIEQLAAKYNTALSAELAFANAQKEVARAVQLGVLSADQADAALERLQASYATTGNAATVMGGKVANANRHILNMGFQFQDIGMMMASGQNPLILAMQQGTQVAGIFNQVRMEGRSVFSVLRGGFLGLINPTSLLTIGLIAGGAALGQWVLSAINAGDEAETLEDRLERLSDAQSGMKSTSDILRMSVQELTDEYGEYAGAVRDAALALAELQIAETQRTLSDQAALAADVARSYYDVAQVGYSLQEALGRIQQDFQVTYDTASQLEPLMRALGESTTFDQQTNALRQIQSYLAQNNIELRNIPESLQAAITQMLELQIQTASTAAEADRLAEAMEAVYTGPTGGGGRGGRRGGGRGVTGSREFRAPRSGATGGGGGDDGFERRLEALRQSLMSERELIDLWYVEQQSVLNDRRAAELMGIEAHNEAKALLEQEYQNRIAEYQRQAAQHEINMRQSTVSAAIGLLNQLGKESEAAAKAALVLQAAQRVAEIQASTAAAAMRAMAELGPIAGPPAAARIWAMGRVQQAIAAASAALNLGRGSGGGASGGGGGGGMTNGQSTMSGGGDRRVLVTWDGPGWAKEMFQDWTNQIFEASGDGKVIFR